MRCQQPCSTVIISTADCSCQQLPWQSHSTSTRSSHNKHCCRDNSIQQRGCRSSSNTSSKRVYFSLLVVLLLLHSLQAVSGRTLKEAQGSPPCVSCDDCVTSSCLRVCVPSCKPGSDMPEGSSLSTDQCKHKGQESALDIATAACKLSQLTCEVSPKLPAHFAVATTVTASQCAALANSGCQKMASSSTYSPCGANQYFGHRTCSGRQFSEIYKVKVGELCLAAMYKLSG